MGHYTHMLGAQLVLVFGAALVTPGIQAQQKAAGNSVQAHMVVTVEPLADEDETLPALTQENVKVQQQKDSLAVTQWIPSRGEQAGLQLFILIDDTSDTRLGSQLDDLRAFINAQPEKTWIGVGYMRNTTVNIVQNFTSDHAAAAKALRLPLGSLGASDSPYLSLVNLIKGWPENTLRREVLMVTDGIDRLRGRSGEGLMPYISPDVDTASTTAQRYGVLVHSIYTRGVGHAGRNYFVATNGENGLAKLADETGGESFFSGTMNPVSFKPYLDRLQMLLENQYYLVFMAKPGTKPGLQRVKISTPIPKVEIGSADNVWVPASKPRG